jgi:DNA-binding NtrC family response regulator
MKKESRILIIDDNKDVLVALKLLLQDHFKQIDTSKTPNVIPEKLRKNDYDAIILDMNFVAGVNTGNEGFYWLDKIFELDSEAAVLFLTAYSDIEKAVYAIKMGAVDYIEKPWDDEKLVASVFRAVSMRNSRKEIKALKKKQKHLNQNLKHRYNLVRGNSPKMQKVYDTINKVAHTDANILILGENGTGKGLIAREIHYLSSRTNEMFVNVDMAALNENVFESELFGHVKGAFTDAKEDRAGRFELASGGTLFLDEIGNLSMNMQSKLLVALQNREITPVGSSKNIPVDIRLICATNKNIQDMIKSWEFREDLLYRINTITIELPPLRDRKEDIPELTKYFANLYADKYHHKKMDVSEAAIKKLMQHDWPGNIRELQHFIEKSVIMSGNANILGENQIMIHQSPKKFKRNTLNLSENEKMLIDEALDKSGHNYTKAAEELGITRRTLYNKLKQYGFQ